VLDQLGFLPRLLPEHHGDDGYLQFVEQVARLAKVG
jgi:hypothetical protein